MDRLSAVFQRYLPTARVFFSGNLCRRVSFDSAEGVGHLHILKSGCLRVADANDQELLIDQPSVLFYPRPTSHRFATCDDGGGAELLCASIDLGSAQSNPFAEALPEVMLVPLARLHGLQQILSVMFGEAFEQHCGRQVALDNLAAYCLVVLLRYVIDSGDYQWGLLAGLSDSKLARALTALHEQPAHPWTLESLADRAGMSRARFAAHFKKTVGTTPMAYVSRWRMGVAQSLLRRGYSIKQVAPRVGYLSAAAMTRTFTQQLGLPPSDWLQQSRQLDDQLPARAGLDSYVPTLEN